MAKSVKSRVVGLEWVKAPDLEPHPDNVRIHPKSQVANMRRILDELGFAGVILARPLKDGKYQILDGHLRVGIGGEDEVYPVVVLDLNAEEARALLMTYDAVGAQAQMDVQRIRELVDKFRSGKRKEMASQVLNLPLVQALAAAEDIRQEKFAAHKAVELAKQLEEESGVEIADRRKHFWVYCEFDPEEIGADAAMAAEQRVLEVLGTGRSRQLDPEKLLQACELYSKEVGE